MRRLGIRTLRGPDRPRRPARGRRARSSTGRRAASTSRTCSPMPDGARGHAAPARAPAGLAAAGRARLEADRGGQATRSTTASRSPASSAIRNVNRTVGGLLSSAVTEVHGADGPAAGDDPLHAARLGRAVVRRLAGAGRRADADRRRQRLHRQGPVRRRARRAPARRRDVRGRGERGRSATPCSTARPPAARSSAGSRASASRCATRAPARSSRASATTAAST